MTQPIIVALNGIPKSGKSAVQDILHRRFSIQPVDDGEIIRRHCRELFDLSEYDVSTQDGKASFTDIQGVSWENRKVLGEYGAILEEKYGPLTVPNAALRNALSTWPEDRQFSKGYSFGSVRRGQAEAYVKAGGIVVEIIRPGVEQSGNIWDTYDQRWVNYTFINDSNGLDSLETEFVAFFTAVLDRDFNGETSVA